MRVTASSHTDAAAGAAGRDPSQVVSHSGGSASSARAASSADVWMARRYIVASPGRTPCSASAVVHSVSAATTASVRRASVAAAAGGILTVSGWSMTTSCDQSSVLMAVRPSMLSN